MARFTDFWNECGTHQSVKVQGSRNMRSRKSSKCTPRGWPERILHLRPYLLYDVHFYLTALPSQMSEMALHAASLALALVCAEVVIENELTPKFGGWESLVALVARVFDRVSAWPHDVRAGWPESGKEMYCRVGSKVLWPEGFNYFYDVTFLRGFKWREYLGWLGGKIQFWLMRRWFNIRKRYWEFVVYDFVARSLPINGGNDRLFLLVSKSIL